MVYMKLKEHLPTPISTIPTWSNYVRNEQGGHSEPRILKHRVQCFELGGRANF